MLVDSYVTTDAGTGVVHQAPYFGEVSCQNSNQQGSFMHTYGRYCLFLCIFQTFLIFKMKKKGKKEENKKKLLTNHIIKYQKILVLPIFYGL